jgi:hypothetical protein
MAVNTWRFLWGEDFALIVVDLIAALLSFDRALRSIVEQTNATPEQLEEMRQSIMSFVPSGSGV